eukprot:gene1145-10659_t
MEPDVAKSYSDSIKQKETIFFEKLDDKEKEILLKIGLKPESLLFFGEIHFLLLNLKQCVFFSNLNENISKKYYDFVLKDSNIFDFDHIQIMSKKIETENYSSHKEMILFNKNTKLKEEIEKLKNENFMKEKEIALLLDYPSHLPEQIEMNKIIKNETNYQIYEVAYFINNDLIMTYGIRSFEIEIAKQHFKKYKNISKLNLRMEILAL